jgi:ribose transport system substrate-binding protein
MPNDRKKVIVSLLAKEQEFQTLQASDATVAASRLGIDLEIIFAKNNSRLQIEQLYHYIHLSAKPAALVVQTVAGDGLPQVARAAAKAGLGWVLLNRDVDYIDALQREHATLPIGTVTVDQIGIGRIQGQQIRKMLPRGGNVLYIEGPIDTSAARGRRKGVDDTIAGTAINLKSLHGDWSEVSAERSVLRWLELSATRDYQLALVAAQNDAMATGARTAFATARPEWLSVPFIGCDGLTEGGQKLVREGKLAATVVLPPTSGAAINMIAVNEQKKIVLTPKAYPAQ